MASLLTSLTDMVTTRSGLAYRCDFDAADLLQARIRSFDNAGSHSDEEEVEPPPPGYVEPSDYALSPFDYDFYHPSPDIPSHPLSFRLENAPSPLEPSQRLPAPAVQLTSQGAGCTSTSSAPTSSHGYTLPAGAESSVSDSEDGQEQQVGRKRKRRRKHKKRPAAACETRGEAGFGAPTKHTSVGKKAYKKKRRNQRRTEQDALRAAGLGSGLGDITDEEDLSRPVVNPVCGRPDLRAPVGETAKAIALARCQTVEAVPVDFTLADDTPVSSVGWSGVRQPRENYAYSYAECLKLGVKPIPWNGRDPLAFLDRNDKAVVYGAGRPRFEPSTEQQVGEGGKPTTDADGNPVFVDKWDVNTRQATELVREGAENATFTEEDRHHRRGDFRVLNRSISYGGGHQFVGNRVNTKRNAKVLDDLVEAKPIQRIAGFQSGAMLAFAPRLHAYYKYVLNTLLRCYFWLIRNFPGSVFAAIAINFGLQTICFPHLDDANLAWGWCAITALGFFDHTKGGHLVLWDLGVMIEFPPGSTILLPSALLRHSNTTILRGEERFSIIQYSAAGIFRWVFNGGMSDSAFLSRASGGLRAKWEEAKLARFESGIAMLPTIRAERIKDSKTKALNK